MIYLQEYDIFTSLAWIQE